MTTPFWETLEGTLVKMWSRLKCYKIHESENELVALSYALYEISDWKIDLSSLYSVIPDAMALVCSAI